MCLPIIDRSDRRMGSAQHGQRHVVICYLSKPNDAESMRATWGAFLIQLETRQHLPTTRTPRPHWHLLHVGSQTTFASSATRLRTEE